MPTAGKLALQFAQPRVVAAHPVGFGLHELPLAPDHDPELQVNVAEPLNPPAWFVNVTLPPSPVTPTEALQFEFHPRVVAGQLAPTHAEPFHVCAGFVHLHPGRFVTTPVPVVALPEGQGGYATAPVEKMRERKSIKIFIT